MDSFLWVSHRLGMGGEGSFSIKTRITLGGTNPPSPGVSGTRGFLKLHPQDGPWVPAGAGGQALCQELRASQGHGQLRKTEVS